jgi:hypothetical protein
MRILSGVSSMSLAVRGLGQRYKQGFARVGFWQAWQSEQTGC